MGDSALLRLSVGAMTGWEPVPFALPAVPLLIKTYPLVLQPNQPEGDKLIDTP